MFVLGMGSEYMSKLSCGGGVGDFAGDELAGGVADVDLN